MRRRSLIQNFAACFILLLSVLLAKAQTADSSIVLAKTQTVDTSVVDMAHIRYYQSFQTDIEHATGPRNMKDQEIPTMKFLRDAARLHPGLPNSFLDKSLVLRFVLTNSADTANEMYFIPGFFARNITIYKSDTGIEKRNFHRLPDSATYTEEYGGCRRIRLEAGETAAFYANTHFIRSNINNFSPRLIEKDYLPNWLRSVKDRDRVQDMITYIVAGIMLMMIFYSLAVYLQSRAKEFLYYSAYTLCTATLLFLKSHMSMDYSSFNFLYEEYLDFVILTGGVFFYIFFLRKFLNTKQEHPFLERFLRVSEIILAFLILVFSIVYFFTNRYEILNILENYIIKLLMFIIGINFIVYSIKRKNTLLTFLAAGNFALVVFSILSLTILLFKWKLVPSDRSSIFNRSLFYYEVGLVLELILFLSGLAYKNRRDIIEQVKETERYKLENERQEFENQMAVLTAQQEERNRISADMHDELGSGVTAIRLMSEIVKSKLKESSFPEIEKISNSANELLGKMNTIIWTMKSSNDTLESLVAYIRAHATEYFDTTPISCEVQVSDMPDVEMSGEKRRNIFLSIKEALNNTLKHSHASKVLITIKSENGRLQINICDNGVGIDQEKLRRFGNGLSNMRKRMQSINGDFNIETNNGTILIFEVPF